MRILVGKIVQLAFGAILGCVVGGIVTGNENYGIALAVGVPLLITVLSVFGARGVKAQRAAGTPMPVRQGIISTIPGLRTIPLRTEPVLNPASSAQPSPGVVLNGAVVAPSVAPGEVPTAGSDSLAPTPVRAPLWWRVLSVVTIVAGAVLVLVPSSTLLGWFVSDVAAGRPFDGRDMITGRHQQDAFDQLAEVIGGTEVISINFYGDNVQVSAPSSPGVRTIDLYVWRAGVAENRGPDYSQPSDPVGERFDAADIDMGLIPTLVRRSLDDADLEGVDSVYPSIRRPDVGEDPVIGIPISGAYFSAYYTYSISGELLQRSGSAFG